MFKPWQFLLDDPPTNATPGEGAAGATPPVSATPTQAPSSFLSNATDGLGTPAGEGGEAAPEQGAEGAEGGAGFRPAQKLDTSALVIPEGFTLSEEQSGAFADLLNDEKLSVQERGQKLLDLYADQIGKLTTAGQEAAVAAWTDMNNQWREEVRALPEFAKDLEGTLGATKQALIANGATKEFFDALDLTGAGNNPHVIQMLHKLAKPYIEGKAVGEGSPATAKSRDAALAALYPTMQPKG